MATTTNYSWSTPDDTALVKDGAAAIRTLGSSADTTVKALNPGTTAGDIDYYTTSTAKARVGIGTAGQLLRVNSGATAPEWATISTGGMTLINSGGTTLTGASITISSIPATYVDLYLVIQNGRTATSGANFLMRINSDTANRYDENSANTIANGTFPNSSWIIAFNSDSGASTSLATVSIPDYANTTTWKSATNLSITNNPGVPANFNAIRYMQFYNQTAAISSLTIFPSAGNWTSGTAYLYGVK